VSTAERACSRALAALTLGWSDSRRGRAFLRRTLKRLVRLALLARSRPLRPESLAPVLVIAPHPDDESLGCGGTVALVARKTDRLHVVFITDGGASHPNHPRVTPFGLAALRKSEAYSATRALGIGPERLTFLDARDGTLSSLDDREGRELAEKISGLLLRLAPRTVLLPCRNDGSSEHEAAFSLVVRALGDTKPRPRLLEFPVWSWWNPLLLLRSMRGYPSVWRVELGDAIGAKALAVAAYASQSSPIPPESTSALPPGFVQMFLGNEEFLLEK